MFDPNQIRLENATSPFAVDTTAISQSCLAQPVQRRGGRPFAAWGFHAAVCGFSRVKYSQVYALLAALVVFTGGRQDGVVRQAVRGAPRRHRKSHLQDGKVNGPGLPSCLRLDWVRPGSLDLLR